MNYRWATERVWIVTHISANNLGDFNRYAWFMGILDDPQAVRQSSNLPRSQYCSLSGLMWAFRGPWVPCIFSVQSVRPAPIQFRKKNETVLVKTGKVCALPTTNLFSLAQSQIKVLLLSVMKVINVKHRYKHWYGYSSQLSNQYSFWKTPIWHSTSSNIIMLYMTTISPDLGLSYSWATISCYFDITVTEQLMNCVTRSVEL